MTFKVDDLVEEYFSLKASKERIEAFAKEKIEPITERLNEIKSMFKDFLDETGQSSAKTTKGTFFKKISSSVTVKNLDEVINFIKDNNAFDLMESKVNKTAALDYIDRGFDLKGVDVTKAYVINVRKNSEK